MDQEVLFIIAFVVDFVFAKGYISHSKIEEIIRMVCGFKAADGYIRFLVKLLGYAPGQRIQEGSRIFPGLKFMLLIAPYIARITAGLV